MNAIDPEKGRSASAMPRARDDPPILIPLTSAMTRVAASPRRTPHGTRSRPPIPRRRSTPNTNPVPPLPFLFFLFLFLAWFLSLTPPLSDFLSLAPVCRSSRAAWALLLLLLCFGNAAPPLAPAPIRDRSMVMASAGVNNMPAGPGAGSEGADPAAECRLRRRRRLAPPRHVASTCAGSDESAAAAVGGEEKVQATPHSSDSSDEDSDVSAAAINVASAAAGLPAAADAGAATVWPVAFGSVALAGRLREMEDTVSLHPSFCVWADGSPMHFFAVFDGHGGPYVAALCREQMHAILATELAAAAEHYLAHRDEEGSWRAALSRSFARVDALAPGACACGRTECACPLSSGQRGAIVGSTAVVALLVRDRLVVANCGDSRAVLCRGAHAVPLSEDQKPDRPDERARIEAVGGRVMFINGARVRGILAMSRALGHKLLKPEVICEPEITITTRSDDDECLILASDGLWDVISNKVACDVARQCLEDGSPTRARTAGSGEAGPSSSGGAPVAQQPEPRCYRASALLARLALGRESSDNISVVVIDLKARS